MYETRATLLLAVLIPAFSNGCYHGIEPFSDGTESGDGPMGTDGAQTQGDGGDGPDQDDSDPLISECRRPTYEVFQRLAPSCVGCHQEGTNVPLAADLRSFEQLVAYNAELVVAGQPEDSALLDMLRGQAPPPLTQMPPGAVTFAELAERGDAEITMDELEAWITDLEPCDLPGGGGSEQFARRKKAEHIVAALMDQLDLTLQDVEHSSRFPVDDPSFPELPSGHNSRAGAQARWEALGGPDYLRGNRRVDDVTPLFLETLGPTAQAWCRQSITLGRDALFRHVGPGSDSAQDEPAIRDNIRFLFLKMLGVDATDEDVEAMFRDVYLPYEAAQDSTTAWVAVCAAFVRHPLWMTY